MDYSFNRKKAQIDNDIINLNDNERTLFYELYFQEKKSKIVYLLLTVFLYQFAGPFFYVGFRYFEPIEYIYVILRLFIPYVLVTLFLTFITEGIFIMSFFLVFLLILFFILDFYMKIRIYSKCELLIDRRNYENKEEVLLYINQEKFGRNNETF